MESHNLIQEKHSPGFVVEIWSSRPLLSLQFHAKQLYAVYLRENIAILFSLNA